MIAILGGLGAAVMWAAANLTSSRASRLIGASSTAAWMLLVGLVVAAPLALASGPLPTLTPTLMAWMAGSGVGGTLGLLLVYRGLRIGKVGVVAALASTEGAIAAVLAVVAGERMNIPVAAMLIVIAVGIVTVALATGTKEQAATSLATGPEAAGVPGARLTTERRAALFGAAAAICFGISIYSTAMVGASMTPFAAVLPIRIVGVVGVFIPLLLTGRLRMTRPALPMVVFIGVVEVLGNVSYVVGSGQSIAIAAVLASQFAALAAVGAFFLFQERLSLHQRSGVVVIALGVAVLTVARG